MMKEIDYQALRYLMERTQGPKLQKQFALKRFDKAWKSGELYIPENEEQTQKWWRCEARFLMGDYSDWGGWQYRSPMATRMWFESPFKCPVWKAGRVKKLAVLGEQGIGDEVFFASCLVDLREKVDEIVLETAPRLQGIMERSFGIKTVAAKFRESDIFDDGIERVIREPYEYDADEWVTLADLGRITRHKDSDFHREAYLKPDPVRVDEFKHLQGRVGISWRGAQGERDWKELLKEFPNAISLQYDQSWDEDVERPDVDLKNDLEGVMGVLANLEKVITVSTSVAHFSAAMGVNTEVRLAKIGSGRRWHLIPFKWINRKHPRQSLWYPKTTKTFEAPNVH